MKYWTLLCGYEYDMRIEPKKQMLSYYTTAVIYECAGMAWHTICPAAMVLRVLS